MKWLLDTHVFLWMGLDRQKFGASTSAILTHANNDLYLSVGSIWEMAIKSAAGKLRLPVAIETYVPSRMRRSRTQTMPIAPVHVFAAASLAWAHRDPFDRLLIAQGAVESLTIVSADERILEFGSHVMDART